MNERNLHKKIEEQNTEEKKVVWQDIEPNISQKKSLKSFFVRYKRLFVALASCFVCLAVILPVTLRYINSDKPGSGGDDDPRYCTSDEYEVEIVEQTLKEYILEFNKSFLYLDWYENAIVCETKHIKDIVTSEILCWNERIINGNTGDEVTLNITSKNIVMDFIDENLKFLDKETKIQNINIKWYYTSFEGFAYFEYEDYCYYLNFYYPMSEQTIFDVVEEMLSVAS